MDPPTTPPYAKYMIARVFVSHAGEDKEYVQVLVDQLQREGFDVWYDLDELDTRAATDKEIKRALDDSRIVIAVVSPDYLRKEYPRRELEQALASETSLLILVHHRISREEVAETYPQLASAPAIASIQGIDKVVRRALLLGGVAPDILLERRERIVRARVTSLIMAIVLIFVGVVTPILHAAFESSEPSRLELAVWDVSIVLGGLACLVGYFVSKLQPTRGLSLVAVPLGLLVLGSIGTVAASLAVTPGPLLLRIGILLGATFVSVLFGIPGAIVLRGLLAARAEESRTMRRNDLT